MKNKHGITLEWLQNEAGKLKTDLDREESLGNNTDIDSIGWLKEDIATLNKQIKDFDKNCN